MEELMAPDNAPDKENDPQDKSGFLDAHPKTKKGLLIAGNVLFWSFIAFLLSFPVVSIIDRANNYSLSYFGYRSSIIVSSSMENANPENDYLTDDMSRIQMGDMIITKDYASYEDIALYDVLTYVTDSGLICHRVIDLYQDEEGNKWIVTRGDSNNVSDLPFDFESVRGRVVYVLGGLNGFNLYLRSAYSIIGICGAAFFVSLGLFIAEGAKEKKGALETPKEGGQDEKKD